MQLKILIRQKVYIKVSRQATISEWYEKHLACEMALLIKAIATLTYSLS